MNDQTKDQIASVMLQRGTPEQQKEALLYCSDISDVRTGSNSPSAYRLKLSNGVLILQGSFQWSSATAGGFEWRDIPTVVE